MSKSRTYKKDQYTCVDEWGDLDPDVYYTKKESELLKLAEYINNKSLGTIDVFSVLRKTYEQGVKDGIKRI